MTPFVNQLLQVIMMVLLLFIYILTAIIIKPFLINRRRLISTLSLKLSFMLYLLFLMVCFFLFLFYGPSEENFVISDLTVLLSIVFAVIPIIAIMIRRNFKRYRVTYNYIFTVYNLAAFGFLLKKIIEYNWFL